MTRFTDNLPEVAEKNLRDKLAMLVDTPETERSPEWMISLVETVREIPNVKTVGGDDLVVFMADLLQKRWLREGKQVGSLPFYRNWVDTQFAAEVIRKMDARSVAYGLWRHETGVQGISFTGVWGNWPMEFSAAMLEQMVSDPGRCVRLHDVWGKGYAAAREQGPSEEEYFISSLLEGAGTPVAALHFIMLRLSLGGFISEVKCEEFLDLTDHLDEDIFQVRLCRAFAETMLLAGVGGVPDWGAAIKKVRATPGLGAYMRERWSDERHVLQCLGLKEMDVSWFKNQNPKEDVTFFEERDIDIIRAVAELKFQGDVEASMVKLLGVTPPRLVTHLPSVWMHAMKQGVPVSWVINYQPERYEYKVVRDFIKENMDHITGFADGQCVIDDQNGVVAPHLARDLSETTKSETLASFLPLMESDIMPAVGSPQGMGYWVEVLYFLAKDELEAGKGAGSEGIPKQICEEAVSSQDLMSDTEEGVRNLLREGAAVDVVKRILAHLSDAVPTAHKNALFIPPGPLARLYNETYGEEPEEVPEMWDILACYSQDFQDIISPGILEKLAHAHKGVASTIVSQGKFLSDNAVGAERKEKLFAAILAKETVSSDLIMGFSPEKMGALMRGLGVKDTKELIRMAAAVPNSTTIGELMELID